MKNAKNIEKYNAVFPTRLRNLIDDNKTTIQALSNEINKTRQAVSQYCSGETQPNVETIIEIAKYFNVSADYLLGLSDSPTTDRDVSFICEYTGLSQNNIEKLRQYKKIASQELEEFKYLDTEFKGKLDALNFLLEYEGNNIFEYMYRCKCAYIENIKQAWNYTSNITIKSQQAHIKELEVDVYKYKMSNLISKIADDFNKAGELKNGK